MRVALAALEAEALAIAPLQGWGLVLPAGDGLVSYQVSPSVGHARQHSACRGASRRLADADFSRVEAAVRSAQTTVRLKTTQVTMGIATLVAIPLPDDRRLVLGRVRARARR